MQVRARVVFVILSVVWLAGCHKNNPAPNSILPATTLPRLVAGVWILNLKAYAKRLGGVEQLATTIAQHGVSYVVPKTHSAYYKKRRLNGWYPTCPPKLFQQSLLAFHRRGIKVYAFVYICGGKAMNTEYAMATEALDSGADGVVLNAETEYCRDATRYTDAETFCDAVRRYRDTFYPGHLLAYSTFARSWKGRGKQFPYRVFGQYCDQFWPQTYWRTFGQTPEAAILEVDEQIKAKYARWRKLPRQAVGIKPIVHTGHAYANAVPPSELRQFMTAAVKRGYREVNLYVADRFNAEQWAVINEFTHARSAVKSPIAQVQPTEKQHGVFGWIWAALYWVASTVFWLIKWALKIYVVIAIARGIAYWISHQSKRNVLIEAIVNGIYWPIDLYQTISS